MASSSSAVPLSWKSRYCDWMSKILNQRHIPDAKIQQRRFKAYARCPKCFKQRIFKIIEKDIVLRCTNECGWKIRFFPQYRSDIDILLKAIRFWIQPNPKPINAIINNYDSKLGFIYIEIPKPEE